MRDRMPRFYSLHTEAALFATRFVIEKAEAFTKANGKKLLVILSFGSSNIARALEGEPLFDQTFLDWFGDKGCAGDRFARCFSGGVRDISGGCAGVFGTVLYWASHAAWKFLFCMGN